MLTEGENMSDLNLIHKSEVYFDIIKSSVSGGMLVGFETHQMHLGIIHIYLDQIYLTDNERLFKANVTDIQEIKMDELKKQLYVNMLNFTIILSCPNNSQLTGLRDFLFLSQNYFLSKRFLNAGLTAAKKKTGVYGKVS